MYREGASRDEVELLTLEDLLEWVKANSEKNGVIVSEETDDLGYEKTGRWLLEIYDDYRE